MSNTQTTLPSFRGVVINVMVTDKDGAPLVKTRENGTKAPYQLCSVKFTEGPLSGQSRLAQRSLVNREGVAKEPVAKGDEVSMVLVSVLEGKPFFEVATSINASDEDVLKAFGLATTATAPVEEEIPLQA